MASFQIHEDQENLIGRSKVHLIKNNTKGLQKRTVLGDVNSNSSRIITRSTKQEVKAVEKLKDGIDFVTHKEKNVLEKIETRAKSKPVPVPVPAAESKENKIVDKPPTLCDTVVSVPLRQPLKDLKVLEQDEDAMSESDIVSSPEPESASPMSLESVCISSPSLRHTKPALQLLYDMDEYRKDIFQYLLQAENRQRPKALYMRRQPDVTYNMRSILVDWLVEVAEEYKLQTETLFLAVSFIDRFLSIMSVVKGKLQLLGTAAMFVAAKYEEIYPPDVAEFVYITDDTYSKRQVLRMEQLILKVLTFDISVPTIYSFLQHIAVECNLSMRLVSLAQYLCELTLLEGDPYLVYVPSIIASAALAVGRHCLEYEDVWSTELQQATGYTLAQLAPCVAHLNVTHTKADSHPQQAVFDKYKSPKLLKVSTLQPKALRIL